MEFTQTIKIDATPKQVWGNLVDLTAWPKFDPFCDGIEGNAALGKQIAIRTKLAPGRVFKVKVTTFEPPHLMVWSDGMPFGLFKGVRTYSLSPDSKGRTIFTMRETFSGPMLPLIKKHLPDMSEAFSSFCNGLKSISEIE